MSEARLYCGDALTVLRTLPEGMARCCVTSPPYWGLRDYGVAGQLGLERTPDEYVANMVEVFLEVRRVLTEDGTLWLVMGDSYCSGGQRQGANGQMADRSVVKARAQVRNGKAAAGMGAPQRPPSVVGVKPKDLVGIPWMLAFALRADGWYLRSDIIWSKPNPMPESVTDRPTKAHEYVFLLSKAARYYYDQAATLEPVSANTHARLSQDVMAQVGSFRAHGGAKTNGPMRAVGRAPGVNPKAELGVVGREKQNASFSEACAMPVSERNARTVWEIPTQPFTGAHFATFPEELARRCILAGTSARGACPKCGAAWERVVEREKHYHRQPKATRVRYGGREEDGRDFARAVISTETLNWRPRCNCRLPNTIDAVPWTPRPDVVLDPFGGSGTVAQVATGNGRGSIYIDLNPKYLELARQRIGPMLCQEMVG